MPSLWVGKVKVLAAQLCPTRWDSVDCSPTRFLCLWDSPGKNSGVVAIPVFLPGEFHGQRSLQSMGSQTVGHN